MSILKSVLHAPAPSVVTVHGARAGVQLIRGSLCVREEGRLFVFIRICNTLTVYVATNIKKWSLTVYNFLLFSLLYILGKANISCFSKIFYITKLITLN